MKALIAALICGLARSSSSDNCTHHINDWIPLKPQPRFTTRGPYGGRLRSSYLHKGGSGVTRAALRTPSASTQGVGFTVGGSQDIENFRENIKHGFVPLPSSITHEGLFSSYHFHLPGDGTACTDLFCPQYNVGVSRDPLSSPHVTPEVFLAVGLDSGLQEFKRRSANIVVVLDISGSMSSPFDKYYYDRFKRHNAQAGSRTSQTSHTSRPRGVGSDWQTTKMDLAKAALKGVLDQLRDDDSLGIVVFESSAQVVKPVRSVCDTDLEAVKAGLGQLETRGGTNMEQGLALATSSMRTYLAHSSPSQASERDNRIIFITDAQPNMGDATSSGLAGMIKRNAKEASPIYTTFVGIGVDFNTDLVQLLGTVRGANYFSVHDSEELRKRLDREFDYLISPMLFDLQLSFVSNQYSIKQVYGAPGADEGSGLLFEVNTLFPSPKTEQGVKGGVILLHLQPNNNASPMAGHTELVSRVMDRQGTLHIMTKTVVIPDVQEGVMESLPDVRKAVLLARYVNLLKAWATEARQGASQGSQGRARPPPSPFHRLCLGCVIPPSKLVPTLGEWERQSVPLKVSAKHAKIFQAFRTHFQQQVAGLQDHPGLSDHPGPHDHSHGHGDRESAGDAPDDGDPDGDMDNLDKELRILEKLSVSK